MEVVRLEHPGVPSLSLRGEVVAEVHRVIPDPIPLPYSPHEPPFPFCVSIRSIYVCVSDAVCAV